MIILINITIAPMATSSSVSDLMINVKPRVLNGGDRICLGVIQIAIVVKKTYFLIGDDFISMPLKSDVVSSC